MAVGLEHRVPPPIVAACVAVIMLGVAWALPMLTFDIPSVLALLIALAGAALGFVGVVQFLRAKTTVNPLQPGAASALVTGGIYRFTRNPMYLGMAAMLLAWGLYLGNLAAIALVGVFVAYIDRFQIGPEERALEARFGAEFAAYRARVRRWL